MDHGSKFALDINKIILVHLLLVNTHTICLYCRARQLIRVWLFDFDQPGKERIPEFFSIQSKSNLLKNEKQEWV
jgi:hypothetical protein